MAKSTAAATAAATRADVPIIAVRLLIRLLRPPAAAEPEGVAPGGVGAGSSSSEPFDLRASLAGRGLPGSGPACCQVVDRIVWVGESWARRGDAAAGRLVSRSRSCWAVGRCPGSLA